MSSLDLSLVTGYETIGSDAANSGGTTLPAAGSANTKGSWVQLTAASAGEASWIDVIIGSNGAAARFLVDIGIGASGSEVVLLADLHFENNNVINSGASYRFPVAIPAGSRIATRIQSSVASAALRVSAVLGSGDPGSATAPGTVVTYGASAVDSGLTQIDPGGTANTDSAWVELTASTTADARWLVLACGHNAAGLTALARWLIDVAIGAMGSETEILSDLATYAGTEEDSPNPRTFAFPVTIPAGTRIAVRARCSNAGNPTRLLDVGVYLADAAAPAGGGGGASAHAFAAWSG